MPNLNYQLHFLDSGQFCFATIDGKSIPYYPRNPTETREDDPLTIEFLLAVEAGDVDISDCTPTIETPRPDWDSFRREITLSPAYLAIVGFNSQTLAINQSLAYILGNSPDRIEEIALYWNAIAQLANPTEEQIEALNLIAINNNIPFFLDEEGLMNI